MPIKSITSIEDLSRIIAVQQEIATSRLDYDDLLTLVCSRTLTLVPGHGAAIEVLEGDDMVYRATAGCAPVEMRGYRLNKGASLSGLALSNFEVYRSDDTERDERVDQVAARKLGVRSMICVPLGTPPNPLGVLKVYSPRVHSYGDREVTLLTLVAGLVGTVIGQAREAQLKQAALRAADASAQALRRLVDTAFEAVVVSKNGRIVEANPRFLEMFRFQADGVMGKSIVDVVTFREQAMVRERVAKNIEGFYEFTGRRSDGSEFSVEGRGTTIFEDDGITRISTMRDVTDRKRTEESLRRSERQSLEAARLKSEFMANISHEIRTPLNGVMGLADLLAGTRLDEEQREYTRLIRSSAGTLVKLVNDILDFSKLEAHKFTLEQVPLSIEREVAETLGPLVASARATGLDLRVSLGDTWPIFLGDATRLRQVLSNLVTNAIKFTPKGHVEVRARVTERDHAAGRIVFEIEDTGIGIPLTARDSLFKPFSQVDASMSRRFGGTGLGLSISRQLVECMGGEMGVESHEGMGSTFWFKVTLPIASEMKRTDSDLVPKVAVAESLRVLIAEDNANKQLIALKMIERMGGRPRAVLNGRLAVRAATDHDYDLILMDCQMPEMDGFEATRRIRDQKGHRLPIIAMTANAMPGDRERCLAAGMNDYVAKPIDYDQLSAVIARWTGAGRGVDDSPASP